MKLCVQVGTGPIIFASVFAAFTRDTSPLPFFPGTSAISCLDLDTPPLSIPGILQSNPWGAEVWLMFCLLSQEVCTQPQCGNGYNGDSSYSRA